MVFVCCVCLWGVLSQVLSYGSLWFSVNLRPATSVLSHLWLLHLCGILGVLVSKLHRCHCLSLFRVCLTVWQVRKSAAWKNETWAHGGLCPGQRATSPGGAAQNTSVFRAVCPVWGLPGTLRKTIPQRPLWLGVVHF